MSNTADNSTIDERDAAQEAVDGLCELILGETPEWSNLYGYNEAYNDCAAKLERERDVWPEWAAKLLRIMEDFGAEYEADDEINLPDELAEWLHHYASDIKQSAERRRSATADAAPVSGQGDKQP